MMAEDYVNFLLSENSIDELEGNLRYLNNRSDEISRLLDKLQDVRYSVNRYDLSPKAFNDYYQWLSDELLKNETERQIIYRDLKKERYARGNFSDDL